MNNANQVNTQAKRQDKDKKNDKFIFVYDVCILDTLSLVLQEQNNKHKKIKLRKSNTISVF
jgi:hypothetical protein